MRWAGWESEELGTTSSRCWPVSECLCSLLCIQDLAEQLQVLQVLCHVTVWPTEVTSLLSKKQCRRDSIPVPCPPPPWAPPTLQSAPMGTTHHAECPHGHHPPCRVPPWAPPTLQSAPMGPTHLAECPQWAPPTLQRARRAFLRLRSSLFCASFSFLATSA